MPADGEARLISRMKRAPSCASVAARLRWVGPARVRRESNVTPSKRCFSSSRLAAAIFARTPTGSATACLDVPVENLSRRARAKNVARLDRGILQARRFSGGVEQHGGVEDRDVGFRG